MNWQHYVIYMGASYPTLNGYGGGDAKFAKSSYMQLLSSIIDPRFILIIFFFIIFFFLFIWPESPSFKDDGVGLVLRRWKGVCMERSDFKKSNCNK